MYKGFAFAENFWPFDFPGISGFPVFRRPKFLQYFKLYMIDKWFQQRRFLKILLSKWARGLPCSIQTLDEIEGENITSVPQFPFPAMSLNDLRHF